MTILRCVGALLLAILSLSALALDSVAEPEGTVTYGLRFMVDDALGKTPEQRQVTEKRLARYVVEMNDFYRNSAVILRAELADVSYIRLASDDVMHLLDDMSQERNGFENLFKRAEDVGADYTVAISARLMMKGKHGCGRGLAVNKTIAEISDPQRRLAVVDVACGAHTLAHELGHLMGLNHGYLVDLCQPRMGHTTAIAPYANGFAIGPCDGKPDSGKFGTIMVGGWMREIQGKQTSLPIFSNPRLHDPRCGKNGVCGDPLIGDEARALNENARYYVRHRATRELPIATTNN